MKQYLLQGVVISIAIYFTLSLSPLSSVSILFGFSGGDDDHNNSDRFSREQSFTWKIINVKNAITTFTTKLEGTRLLGVKGVAIFDMHISDSMAPFVNMSQSYEWIDLLGNIKAYPVAAHDTSQSSSKKRIQEKKSEDEVAPSLCKTETGRGFVPKVRQFFMNLFRKGRQCRDEDSIRRSNVAVGAVSDLSDDAVMKLQDGYELVDVVHQELSLPWPISPRDILLYREFHFQRTDPKAPQARRQEAELDAVTVRYHSTVDARVPPQKGYIRSYAPHVLWRFKALPPDRDAVPELLKSGVTASALAEQARSTYPNSDHGLALRMIQSAPGSKARRSSADSAATSDRVAHHRTIVEVECVVDSKGAIPAWFINFMQMSWPQKTLSKFRTLAQSKRSRAYVKVKDW